MGRTGVLIGLLLVSCGPTEPQEPLEALELALRGGAADTNGAFPQVFMLRMQFDNGPQYVCTATLVTSRTLLTAAHCFDPASAPGGVAQLTGVWAQNASPAPSSASPQWVALAPADTRMHPNWRASDRLSWDIAVALLPAPSTVAPSPYLDRALTAADVGTPLDVVGFGITSRGGTDYGTRKRAGLPLKGLTAKHLQVGDGSGTGLCNGDSGGPSFVTGRDGLKRVVGVHSYDSSLNCNDGLDTRVDLFRGFIQQWLADKEGGATCFEDGLCRPGCTPADVDCVCTANGVCDPACPNLLTDPDCPADCVANGVCATAACPALDADCRAWLSPCTAAAQCQHRVCAADAQAGASYCSQSCSAAAPCPSGTECHGGECLRPQLPTAAEGEACAPTGTFCLGGTACTALPGDTTRCFKTCLIDADCGTPGDCMPAQGGQRLCRPVSAAGAGCVVGLSLCPAGLVCSAPAFAATTCRSPCADDTQCAATEACVDGQGGARVCEVFPPVTLGRLGEATGTAPAGCASVPGGAGALWALALVMRRRRRPA